MTDKEAKPGNKVAKDGHTYHKSATANATTAPTNEATVANAAKVATLTDAQAEFVTILDYEWNLKRAINPEVIREEYGYEKADYEALASNELVIKALEDRGISGKHFIPLNELNGPVGTRAKLTPIQLIVANSMLNLTDTRPPKKKLQDAGVSPYQYQAWMKDPDFKQYMVDISEGLLNDVQHEVLLSLIDRATAGDMKAIEYYMEMTGRYVKQTVSNPQANSAQDFQQMIVRIIEIVVDEVDNPNTAARISDRLKGLVMGNQVAGILANEPISVPEIAEARHLNPEQLAAVSRGVGVND